jgi:hypothetical protein
MLKSVPHAACRIICKLIINLRCTSSWRRYLPMYVRKQKHVFYSCMLLCLERRCNCTEAFTNTCIETVFKNDAVTSSGMWCYGNVMKSLGNVQPYLVVLGLISIRRNTWTRQRTSVPHAVCWSLPSMTAWRVIVIVGQFSYTPLDSIDIRNWSLLFVDSIDSLVESYSSCKFASAWSTAAAAAHIFVWWCSSFCLPSSSFLRFALPVVTCRQVDDLWAVFVFVFVFLNFCWLFTFLNDRRSSSGWIYFYTKFQVGPRTPCFAPVS